MGHAKDNSFIAGFDEPILVTGATGFIGSRVVKRLLDRGFRNVRCFARPSAEAAKIQELSRSSDGARIELVIGNLLSREDCVAATKDVTIILHLAAGTGEDSFPDAFMNSVVTTRNLLDAALGHGCLRRIVSVSSFAVYSNVRKSKGNLLDEACTIEEAPGKRNAYCFAKVKQEEIVAEYGEKYGVPYVFVRPGYVYGPGKSAITPRVGIDTFGVFLHLGGSNRVPLTYVDNCAEAIVLAGLMPGVDGEVFNVVDDGLPSSWQFLRGYKQNVRRFHSIYLPHALSYALCLLWERGARWSAGQIPPRFDRTEWHNFWKKTTYSNKRLKSRLGWIPLVPTDEGLNLYFEACRKRLSDA